MQNQLLVQDEVCRVLEMEGIAILECSKRLKTSGMRQTLELSIEYLKNALDAGGKIVVTGLGKSGKVGQKIAATLCSTGSLAVFLHPTEGLHGDLGLVTSKDVILALSYTGNTEEIVRLFPSFKKLNIPVIGICGNSKSQLAQKSHVWLDASVSQEACPHNLAPTTSTTLALAIGDALAITLMQLRGFDSFSFAKNHPGGSLGNRLNLKVKDLMHQGDSLGVLGPDASMDQVVVESTQKKLGGVLVVQQRKLLGLITDGDIRRALKHKERFFSFKAQEIMTASPTVIDEECMARSALELMENRPSAISVLPVVNSEGEWVGLIRLHDLVKLF